MIKKKLLMFLQVHLLFGVIALIFGIGFAIITPPLWGADEGAHFFRAYQISQGRFSQERVDIDGKKSLGGYIPESFRNLDKLRQQDIEDANPIESKQVDNSNAYKDLGDKSVNKEKNVANPYGQIIYPIITYTAPAVGVIFGSLFNSTALSLLFSARIATLALYVCLGVLSLYIIRKSSIKWIVFMVAVLPMSIFQASVVSADSLVFGLSLVLFSLIYRAFHMDTSISKRSIASIAAVSALLTIIKPPYVILVLALFFLTPKGFIPTRKKLFIKIGIPVLCTTIAILCLISVRGIIAEPLPHISSLGQLHWIIIHPVQYVYVLINSISIINWVPQIIGLFGASFVFIPGILSQILLVSLTLTTFVKTQKDTVFIEGSKSSGIIYVIAGVLVSLAVITTLYLTWTPIGANLVEGVQGRYFLPVVAFILVGVRMLTKARLIISEKTAITIYSTLAIVSLSVSLLWYYKILY